MSCHYIKPFNVNHQIKKKMVLGEASKKEQQGPRSHKVVDPTANERKDDDIEIQVQG